MNYNKLILKRETFAIPYLIFDKWKLSPSGIIAPDRELYNPGQISLLKWKAAFYDRGKKLNRDLYLNNDYGEIR